MIDKGNFRVRKTLESWHTAITNHDDNNAKLLPRQYSILFTPHISIFTRTQAFPLFLIEFCFFTLFIHVVYISMFALSIYYLLKTTDW